MSSSVAQRACWVAAFSGTIAVSCYGERGKRFETSEKGKRRYGAVWHWGAVSPIVDGIFRFGPPTLPYPTLPYPNFIPSDCYVVRGT